MVFGEIVRNSLVVFILHWLQRTCERGITAKKSLTISLKTIHWLQRTCERGINTTKEFKLLGIL
jgi:hypothetical protein